MEIKNKVVKNYIFNAGYQVMALIVPLITTPYISRVLTSEGIGIYSYTYSIVCYFTICAILGTAIYGKKSIGILQDNPEERTKKFWDIFAFRFITSMTALVLYIGYVIIFVDNKTIALLQSFYILGVMSDVSWMFQGMEDFERVAIRNFIFKALNVALVFIVIKEESDLWKYVLLLAMLTVVGNISMWPFLSKYLVKIPGNKIRPFTDIKVILKLFVPAIATQLYCIIDKNMIGNITMDPNQNGYYEQADKIVKMSMILITSIATVLLPKVSKSYSEKKYDEVKEDLSIAYRFVWFMGVPLMCGVTAISSVLVPVFLGAGYEPVIIILPILSILFVIMSFNQINCTLFFVSAERETEYLKYMIIGGVVNVTLNYFFITKYGAIGAAAGTVLGELVITIFEFSYIKKQQFVSIKKVFVEGTKYYVAGLFMLIILKLMVSNMNVSIFSLLLLILVGVVLYFTILILLKEKFVMKFLHKQTS